VVESYEEIVTHAPYYRLIHPSVSCSGRTCGICLIDGRFEAPQARLIDNLAKASPFH
jgi:hypothetical protein